MNKALRTLFIAGGLLLLTRIPARAQDYDDDDYSVEENTAEASPAQIPNQNNIKNAEILFYQATELAKADKCNYACMQSVVKAIDQVGGVDSTTIDSDKYNEFVHNITVQSIRNDFYAVQAKVGKGEDARDDINDLCQKITSSGGFDKNEVDEATFNMYVRLDHRRAAKEYLQSAENEMANGEDASGAISYAKTENDLAKDPQNDELESKIQEIERQNHVNNGSRLYREAEDIAAQDESATAKINEAEKEILATGKRAVPGVNADAARKHFAIAQALKAAKKDNKDELELARIAIEKSGSLKKVAGIKLEDWVAAGGGLLVQDGTLTLAPQSPKPPETRKLPLLPGPDG